MMKTWMAVAVGVVLGAVALVAVRAVATAPEEPVHFHANFAMFVNGERYDLSDDRFMEDVALCGEDAHRISPPARVHLHNNNQDVVHVHHGGATWGHFMANLRMVLGDRILVTRDGEVHQTGGGSTLKFILNGRPELSVYNEPIRPGDRLLVSYGAEAEAEVVASQFPQVASDAPQFDLLPDPAGCGGGHSHGWRERLRHALIG